MRKKINSEIRYYFWLYKQQVKKLIYYFEIYSSLLCFYIPFVPFDWKIRYLPPNAIPLLNKKLFKNLFSIDLPKYTFNYIKKFFHRENLTFNQLRRIAWLTASFRGDKDFKKEIIKLFEGEKFYSISLLKKRSQILHPFTILGDYDHLDALLISTREKLNFLENRKEGFYKEVDHFTAIGHLCLFAYLIQGVECGFLCKDINEYKFIFDLDRVHNKLFANLLKDLAKKLKIKILEFKVNDLIDDFDSELEIWPSQKNNFKSLLARKEYYKLAKEISEKRNFLKVPRKYILLSKRILSSFSIDSKKFFVGLHLRSNFDERTNRNTSIENSKYICELIKSEGGIPLLVGANKFLSRELKNYALDIRDICNTTYEYEALQLFIWSNCKFWVGSQSGGTLPASLFGTLTLWLDFHPSGHFHPPNTKDLFVPRRVFNMNLNRFLSWDESTSDRYRFCQTENVLYARHFGYKLFPAHKDSVNKAFYRAMKETNANTKKYKNNSLSSRIFYKVN